MQKYSGKQQCRDNLCPGTAGPVSWDRWTCVLGPLDLCPGTAAWVVSECVGVSSVGVSGVSDVSDVSDVSEFDTIDTR